jgi:phage-related protein
MKPKFEREVVFYGNHFHDFYLKLDRKTKIKIDWTIDLFEKIEIVPEKYLKHLTNTDGLYEMRIECSSNIYRVFCFFDEGKLIIAINGFQKKSQKTPSSEIDKALRIKNQYFNEK